MVTKITDVILLNSKIQVIRLHLYAKLLQIGFVPYDKDLDVIIELYKINGYANEKEQLKFFNTCLHNKYKKSQQSIRNTLATYTKIGILEKPQNKKRVVSEKWIPPNDFNVMVLDYKVSHAINK